MIRAGKTKQGLLLLLCLPLLLQAQKRKKPVTDTLAAMRVFINVCNTYKQLPLQLQLQVRKTTNLVTIPEDTAGINAAFYLDTHGSYTSFGEMEQVINDSLVVMVSHRAKRIMLYPNRQAVVTRMQQFMGIQSGDSSLAVMAKKYTVSIDSAGNTGHIQLTGRALLYGTSIPKEAIEMDYNTTTLQPVKVTELKRSLVPVDPILYQSCQEDKSLSANLVVIDNRQFIVKEQRTDFIYNNTSHDLRMVMPVQVNDRITKTVNGKYIPAKGFESFLLNDNL